MITRREKQNFLLQILLVLIKVLRTSSVQNHFLFTCVISLMSDLRKPQWTKLISVPATDTNVGKKVLKFWDCYANMVFDLPSVKVRFSFTSLVPNWLNFSKWGTNYWSCHLHQRRSMGWRFQLQQPFYYILHRRQKASMPTYWNAVHKLIRNFSIAQPFINHTLCTYLSGSHTPTEKKEAVNVLVYAYLFFQLNRT